MTIHCPVCAHDGDPAGQVATIAICAHCGATLVIDAGGSVRRAMAQDTELLGLTQMQTLRRARAKIARPERR